LVAKLKLPDVEKEMLVQGIASRAEDECVEANVG